MGQEKLHYKIRSSSGRVHEKVDYYEGVITNLSMTLLRNDK